jgi:F-type H+-transporting ATPase subunit h
MYLRELKNYKPPAVKASDAEGHVQKFSIPKPPPSPEETDLASEMKAYETQTVELEGQAAEGEEAVVEDWFDEEADELKDEKAAAH